MKKNVDSNIIMQVENISFSYRAKASLSRSDPKSTLAGGKNISAAILKDFSLQITSGEAVVLLGANGCGKSTLLKILAGLIYPQKGRVMAFGREISEKILLHHEFGMYFRAAVGVLFQNSDAQLFNPTVAEEIAFGPRQIFTDRLIIEKKVQKVMQLLALENLMDRSPFELSGGEKRKVAIASMLAIEPEVLLLDEPTAGLDPKSARFITSLLNNYWQQGKTIITTTHDLSIVSTIASRVIVFNEQENNKILADGTPEVILKDNDLLINSNLI